VKKLKEINPIDRVHKVLVFFMNSGTRKIFNS